MADDNIIDFPTHHRPGAAFGLEGALLTSLPPQRQPELLGRREEPVTYRLRVDLDDVEPPIWRLIEVPSDLPLDRFHLVLQMAMGWMDSHLHAFTMGPTTRDRETARFVTPHDLQEGDDGTLENDVRLDEVLGEVGHGLYYEYDFGDGWEHTVRLEEVLPAGEAGCRGGARACPPEDCGGIPGYENILALLSGRRDGAGFFADREELIEWLPLGWEPEGFDPEDVDEAVRIVASGGTPGLPDPDRLAPALAELLTRAQDTPSEAGLTALVAIALADAPGGFLADSRDTDGPDDAAIEEAMRPLRVVLDAVGDGVDLTAAGYLRPAQVEAIAAGVDLGSSWIGKMNREDLTPPIAQLRAAAVRLGLLRTQRGRLLPTKAGARLRGDTGGLWRHVVTHLPVGPAQHRDPATLLLLATAGGVIPPEFSDVATQILVDVGWREGRFTHQHFVAAVEPTLDVLHALGVYGSVRDREATDLGMDLATAALLRP